MRDKKVLYAIIEMLLPALLGMTILILIPYHIDVFSSFLVEASNLPKLVPELTAWIMIVISLVQVIRFSITKRIELNSVKGIFKPRVLLGIGILVGYVFILQIIGFIIATFLCIVGVIYLLNRISWYKALLFAGIVSVFIWYAFSQLLRIPLPTGWW